MEKNKQHSRQYLENLKRQPRRVDCMMKNHDASDPTQRINAMRSVTQDMNRAVASRKADQFRQARSKKATSRYTSVAPVEKNELNRCPKCGGDAALTTIAKPSEFDSFFVHCTVCECSTGIHYSGLFENRGSEAGIFITRRAAMEEAAIKWNQRS